MFTVLARQGTDTSDPNTLLLLLVMGGFYFAVIVAIIVWRRGQRRWTLWSVLAALVPIANIIVPILALQQGRVEPAVLTEPCPGCGDHTGWSEHGQFDRESEERLPHVVSAVISGALGVVIGIGAIVLAISIWRGGDQSCSGGMCLEWENGAFIAGASFLVFGLWLAAWVGHWATGYLGAERVDGTSYRCAGCDERWVRLEAIPAV